MREKEVEEHVGDMSPIAFTDSLRFPLCCCWIGTDAIVAVAGLALLPGWCCYQVGPFAELTLLPGWRLPLLPGFGCVVAGLALLPLLLLPGWRFCRVVAVAGLALAAAAGFSLCCCRVGAVAIVAVARLALLPLLLLLGCHCCWVGTVAIVAVARLALAAVAGLLLLPGCRCCQVVTFGDEVKLQEEQIAHVTINFICISITLLFVWRATITQSIWED
jgi:hypothetical protein